MKYYHLYSDATGESRWRDVDVALEERTFAPPARGIHVSEPEATKTMMFLRLHAGWSEPIHPTPQRQMLICLGGAALVTASDGETREIRPGDVWCMEDLSGKGHHTRVIGDEDFDAAIVQYD